jgi:hypothetical protein
LIAKLDGDVKMTGSFANEINRLIPGQESAINSINGKITDLDHRVQDAKGTITKAKMDMNAYVNIVEEKIGKDEDAIWELGKNSVSAMANGDVKSIKERPGRVKSDDTGKFMCDIVPEDSILFAPTRIEYAKAASNADAHWDYFSTEREHIEYTGSPKFNHYYYWEYFPWSSERKAVLDDENVKHELMFHELVPKQFIEPRYKNVPADESFSVQADRPKQLSGSEVPFAVVPRVTRPMRQR